LSTFILPAESKADLDAQKKEIDSLSAFLNEDEDF